MYLVSAFFDEKTKFRIQKYINHVAAKSGNTFMLDAKVPPHLTLSAFETRQEKTAIQVLEKTSSRLCRGTLTWCSAGVFLPYVIYITPVLNDYLHHLSTDIYENLKEIDDIKISPFYRPMQWLPHTTIGKKLSKEEMRAAFQVLQEQFSVFEGQITHIGLSRTNPYEDLICLELPLSARPDYFFPHSS